MGYDKIYTEKFGRYVISYYLCNVRLSSEGAKQVAFGAIFKLDLSDFYAEDITYWAMSSVFLLPR